MENKLTETLRQNFQTHVKKYRKEHNNISQDKLARDILRIDPTLLSKKLNGKISITIGDVEDFSASLGISPYDLLGQKESPDTNVILINEKIASLSPNQCESVIQILDLICKLVQ